MHLIIDGYNLIGVSHDDLKKQRQILIESLITYRKKTGHDITIVFDGWKTGEGREKCESIGGIKVIYSGIGEKADSVIKRIISSERHERIVVTSDRDIMRHAWSAGSIPVQSDLFYEAVERKVSCPSDREYVEDEKNDYREFRRKGNPRKLSKKEKAVRRALRKL